jgi:hypothetical protein
MSREPDITTHLPLLTDPDALAGVDCPDSQLLAAYAEARLPPDQRSLLEEHLADCSYCLGQVGFLVRDADRELPAVPSHLIDAVREPRSRWPDWARKPALAPLAAAATLIMAAAIVFQLAPQPDSSAPTQPASGGVVESSDPQGSERTVRNGTPGDAIRILEPLEGAELSGAVIALNWQHSPQALQYSVLLASLEGDLIWEGRTTESRMSVPTAGLEAGARYFIWVEAQLSGGGTLKSAPIGFRFGRG